jgi:hypothetical protein
MVVSAALDIRAGISKSAAATNAAVTIRMAGDTLVSSVAVILIGPPSIF